MKPEREERRQARQRTRREMRRRTGTDIPHEGPR